MSSFCLSFNTVREVREMKQLDLENFNCSLRYATKLSMDTSLYLGFLFGI